MNIRLLLVISLVLGIAGVAAPAAHADELSDLGFQAGGSILTLPPAQLVDPPPQGAAKEPLFDTAVFTCQTGAIPTLTEFGFVILNTHGPIKGGIPNATYQILLAQDPGNCPNMVSVGTATTNAQGNGNGHAEVSRISTATRFWVAPVDLADLFAPRSILASPAASPVNALAPALAEAGSPWDTHRRCPRPPPRTPQDRVVGESSSSTTSKIAGTCMPSI